MSKSRNRELGELFQSGFGVHHAGMLRSDRNLTERLFSEGLIKVFSTVLEAHLSFLVSILVFFDTTSETFGTLEVLRTTREGHVARFGPSDNFLGVN